MKTTSIKKIQAVDDLMQEFTNRIDWTNYENIDDVREIEIARRLNARYHSKHSTALIEITEAFSKLPAGDTVKQGRLILEAMAEISGLANDTVK